MKYKKVKLYAHPRSGSHYTAALIDKNFFYTGNYLNHYGRPGVHKLAENVESEIRKKKNILYVYVIRNFDAVADSLLRARERFGITSTTYEEFISKRYSDQWTRNKSILGNFRIKVDTINNIRHVSEVFPYFGKINMKPKEYWEIHTTKWIELSKKVNNLIILYYDELQKNLNKELSKLAVKLGTEPKEFEQVQKRVGWYFENDK